MSRYADAAYTWLLQRAKTREVTTEELWRGLKSCRPDLTTTSETRKTPRTTLMRDLRKDVEKRFVIGNRRVILNLELRTSR